MNNKIEVIKSNLNEVNHGHCGSANNARFTGRSVAWAIAVDDDIWFAVNTKRAALAIVEFMKTKEDPNIGDNVMGWFHSHDPADLEEWMFNVKEL